MPSPGNHCHNESDIRIGGSHTLCSLSKQTSGYPSDFGGGMTPEPRNQDLLPTVGGGGWSTPSLPPAGGMTPIVPNSTLGGGWSTPAGSFGGPGPTSQNLRLVSPKSTLDDVWSTPNPYPDTSGASDMTPESKCPDLSPVIPNPTLASEWSSLIHLLQIKEEERKRAENLLRSALAQLELEVETREILEAQVKELEERVERVQRDQGGLLGGDASKEMLAEQKGRVSEGAEVKGLKLKLSNTETELRRIQKKYRALKIDSDDSDGALFRARTLAREMKEKVILIQAREQGRQEGFEEGLKKGRLLGEGSTSETPEAAIRSITEREYEHVRLQLKAVERELDMERERMEDLERENRRLEKTAREERERRDEWGREREKEREASRAKEREKEREMERLELEKDKIREQMEKEKQDVEKKLAETNKDMLKIIQLFKGEKEAVNSPHLPTDPPPRPGISSASQAPHASSTESYSSIDPQASTIEFDMLQLPNGESVIPASEDSSAGRAGLSVNSASGSASTVALPSTLLTNLPINGDINMRGTPNGSTSSPSSFDFEPRSFLASALNTEESQFSGPNHRPTGIPLPQTQTRAESPVAIPRHGAASGIPTKSSVDSYGTSDADGGNFPPGFVLRSISCITDVKGRTAPIIGGGSTWGPGAPRHPPIGFGGGGGGMTPGPGDQDLPPVVLNPMVSGGWNGSSHAAGSFGGTSGAGSTSGPRSQYMPFAISPVRRGTPDHAAGSFGSTTRPGSQYSPPDIYNPTAGGWWGPPSHAFGSFVGGAGSRPGSRNQNRPSVGGGDSEFYQPSSLIYGPSYSYGEGVGEDGDEDPITALNSKMNTTLSMDVGSKEGGSGRKILKKEKKR